MWEPGRKCLPSPGLRGICSLGSPPRLPRHSTNTGVTGWDRVNSFVLTSDFMATRVSNWESGTKCPGHWTEILENLRPVLLPHRMRGCSGPFPLGFQQILEGPLVLCPPTCPNSPLLPSLQATSPSTTPHLPRPPGIILPTPHHQ